MKTHYRIALATISLLWVVTACSSPKPTAVSTQALTSSTEATQPTVTAPTDSAYPPPTTQASPAPSDQQAGATEAAYPAPPTTPNQDQTTNLKVTPFKFDKPIVEGATEITGVGPAGVRIVLSDITDTPVALAIASIAADGKFIFKVTKPLEKSHRIGLGLINLKDSPWVDKNFVDPGFQGTEPTQIPNVGVYYDTAVVQGK